MTRLEYLERTFLRFMPRPARATGERGLCLDRAGKSLLVPLRQKPPVPVELLVGDRRDRPAQVVRVRCRSLVQKARRLRARTERGRSRLRGARASEKSAESVCTWGRRDPLSLPRVKDVDDARALPVDGLSRRSCRAADSDRRDPASVHRPDAARTVSRKITRSSRRRRSMERSSLLNSAECAGSPTASTRAEILSTYRCQNRYPRLP